MNTVKILLREVKEFKTASFLTPVFMILEVIVETLIPLFMAKIIDEGVSQSNMAANVTSASTIQIRRRKIRNTSRASRTTSNGWGSSGIMCTMRAITSRNFGTLPSGSSCRDVPMWTSRALKSSHNKRVQRRSPAPTVLSETVLQKRASSCSAS